MRHRNLRGGGGCPSKAVIGIVTSLLLGIAGTPITANATTTTTTTDAYQLYDQKTRDQQVTVNKIWNDSLTNDTRTLNASDADGSYENNLSMTIQTSTPQTALRTYAITYDANGGSYGTDTNGSTITTNTITYNAKNAPTNGTYAAPERTDGYTFLGWSTNKNATGPDTSIILTNTPTDDWMNARDDGSTTTLYAVWKDIHINYAVMAYGIDVDKDANGSTMGIIFGPALGYPEFSPYNNSDKSNPDAVQTFTKSHSVSGDATVMSESTTACTDTSHSVITGTDAGTDTAGNAYRCLHYDNWATIIYWNEHDPHVYDKCIPNHFTPNAGTIENGTFSAGMSDSDRGLVGDGQSYIVKSAWDNSYDGVDITQAGQGYAVSLIRAKLVGADSHTKLDDKYAGVADRLWLLSYGEMRSAVYPSAGFSSGSYDSKDARRSSQNWWWLRSPFESYYACTGSEDGYLSDTYVSFNGVRSRLALRCRDLDCKRRVAIMYQNHSHSVPLKTACSLSCWTPACPIPMVGMISDMLHKPLGLAKGARQDLE